MNAYLKTNFHFLNLNTYYMKRNNLLLPNLFFLLTFLIVCFQSLHAQQVFKVGDRVMISPSGLKDEKYWRPGTVTEVHNFTPKKAYSVTCDPESAGGNPSSFLVNADWIKPLKEQKNTEVKNNNQPKNNQPQPKTMDQNQNNKVVCPPSDPDSKGATVMERAIRGSIRKEFEREPELNSDGRITVTFQNVAVGSSHTWRANADPDAARGKEIYQVRATFTTCSDYNRRIVLVKRERNFNCYKNNAGEWECDIYAAVNTNVKDETKSIDKNR
jgi:hypothetical protein